MRIKNWSLEFEVWRAKRALIMGEEMWQWEMGLCWMNGF